MPGIPYKCYQGLRVGFHDRGDLVAIHRLSYKKKEDQIIERKIHDKNTYAIGTRAEYARRGRRYLMTGRPMGITLFLRRYVFVTTG